MKSGQILSLNNSKTVLNIVFKFYTLVTEYISCLQTSCSTMATGFGPLAEVTWTEAERRCAVVMILTRKGDILTDSKIADMTGVERRRVNQLRKALTEIRDPWQGVSHAPRDRMASRKVRSTESCPLTSLRLASVSTRTSIWRSWRALSFPASRQWQQDSVPCHVSNRSIKWLKDHCYSLVSKDCWPPSSPDLNLLDYFVLGYWETHTN
jgi:hypothetical protein